MANVKVGRIPIQICQFFWPSTWAGSGLSHFQGGKRGGLRAGGWRLAAGGCARGRPLIIASILRLPGSEQ